MQNPQLVIVGLGPGSIGQLSLAAWEALQVNRRIFLRTGRHPLVPELSARGVHFETFDSVYEEASDFDSLYEDIANQVVAATRQGPVTYAVPGHPFVSETTVRLILEAAAEQGVTVTVIPSMSALDAIYAATQVDPTAGLQIFDALSFTPQDFDPARPAMFLQLYDQFTVSQLKLALLALVDPDTPTLLIHAAGIPGEERIATVPLHEIDRQAVAHLTSLYLGGTQTRSVPVHPLDPLVDVMDQLLGENGCPWDREQTHHSLRRYLIEESYEVVDAIEGNDWESLCEELGDVLLQVVFHAQLATRSGHFSIDDVVATVTAKMKRRHPHVFADVVAGNASEVLRNWEKIKQAERVDKGQENTKGLLSDLPRHLPALMFAEEAQKRAARVGFEWPDVHGALEKVSEEIQELTESLESGTRTQQADELGDVLFALVNVARYAGVDPEDALRHTADKFAHRFRYIEEQTARMGRRLVDMSLEEMDVLWDEAKVLERNGERA